MKNTKYFGDAIAMDWVNFGPGCLAAMMGSNYVTDTNTVWFGVGEYFFKDWSNIGDLRLRENTPMYKMVMDYTRTLAENNDGSYTVGISDLGGNLDILASLRNTQDLLADLYDYPEMVLRAVEIIDQAWIVYFTLLRTIIKESGQLGHTTWLGPWCETTYYPLQCDFAAMISPRDFEKFVIPSLKRVSDFLDHSLFHLDGPGQIAHLDQLLSVPKIDGIQWVPGDGNAPVFNEKWFPMYEKIQAANKCLVLHGLYTVDDVIKICDNLSPKGLWLNIWLNTEAEAEELLKRCNWS
jgi:5-methyltetrahydrofolate--homocysteine methyltransferase